MDEIKAVLMLDDFNESGQMLIVRVLHDGELGAFEQGLPVAGAFELFHGDWLAGGLVLCRVVRGRGRGQHLRDYAVLLHQ
jgi:hypothetical protein